MLIRFLALALFVAALAACGGQPAAAPTATAAPAQPTAAPTQVPTAAPTATPLPPSPTPKPTAVPTATATTEATATATAEPTEAGPTAEPGAAVQPDLPAPADVENLAYDSAINEITYTSASDVAELVAFYRKELADKGWTETQDSAVVNEYLGYLEFTKGDASIIFTIARPADGNATSVTAELDNYPTSGQAIADATPASAEESSGGQAGTEPPKAEDKDGLPVPADYENYSSESTTYRRTLTATSPTALEALVPFYRKELADRKWQELPGAAKVTDTAALLAFADANKQPLEVKLAKNSGGGTDIEVSTKLEQVAKNDGILPPPGKARVYLGNVSGGPVVFVIAGKEFKPESQDPVKGSFKNVPFVDVAPGSLDYTLTQAGQSAVKDKIDVGSGQTWGLIAGPGGALPIQLY